MFVLVENSVKVWAKYLVEFWSYCVSVSFNCRFSRCITMLASDWCDIWQDWSISKEKGENISLCIDARELSLCAVHILFNFQHQKPIYAGSYAWTFPYSFNKYPAEPTHTHTAHNHDIQPKILIEKPKYLCNSHLKAAESWCHFTWNLCDRARHKQKDESISMNFLGGVCSHFMFCHYLLHVHATQQSFE